jgi:hypothetical protein
MLCYKILAMTNKTLKGSENMLRLIITITFFISLAYAQTSKIVYMSYNSTGCVTCHRIASVKMNDTLYLFGTFHNNGKMTPFLIAVDSSLNIKWYKAFNHNLPNLGITQMLKVNDSLVLVSGGHALKSAECSSRNCNFFGLFNVKTQSFVWSKSFSQTCSYGTFMDIVQTSPTTFILLAHRDDCAVDNSGIVKIDINGDVNYQKLVYVGSYYYNVCSSTELVGDKLFISCTSRIIILDTLGNPISSKFINFGSQFWPNKIIRDINGLLVAGFYMAGSDCCPRPHHIMIYKIDFNGNFMWAKRYEFNLGNSRAFNITKDVDGNFLVAGYIETSTTSYPLVLKIDGNGNVIYARYWNMPPTGLSNMAKGIIPISQGKFYLLTYLSTGGVDQTQGFAIIREDTNPNLIGHCTQPITPTISNFTPNIVNETLTITNANFTLNDLALTPYSPALSIINSCQITPISNYEYIKSCDYEIKSQRNYIEINLMKKKEVYIYNVLGKVVYRDKFEGRRRIKLKDGVYIIKLDNEKFKIVVK